MIRRVDHIAIVVKDVQAALGIYEVALGLQNTGIRDLPEQAVKAAFLSTADTEVELLEPTTADSGVARFLEKRGEGIHHICFEVDDLGATLATLRAQGIALLNETPQRGAHGRIAFVHPKSACGVLIELLERAPHTPEDHT